MKPTHTHPTRYEIRVEGHLPAQWSDWFEGLTLTLEANGDTRIAGPMPDQAALHGLLKRVRDLGLTLVSVCPVESDPSTTLRTGQADPSDVE